MQNVKDKRFLELLGKNIKKVRIQKGLTQLDVGVKMDNYAEHIGRIERGKLNITVCTLKKIAEALEVTINDLLTFDES